MGLTGGRDVLGLNGEDDSCPLVSGSSTPTSPSNRPHSGGYINEAIIDSEGTRPNYNTIPPSESLDNTINASITAKNFNIENNRYLQILVWTSVTTCLYMVVHVTRNKCWRTGLNGSSRSALSRATVHVVFF